MQTSHNLLAWASLVLSGGVSGCTADILEEDQLDEVTSALGLICGGPAQSFYPNPGLGFGIGISDPISPCTVGVYFDDDGGMSADAKAAEHADCFGTNDARAQALERMYRDAMIRRTREQVSCPAKQTCGPLDTGCTPSLMGGVDVSGLSVDGGASGNHCTLQVNTVLSPATTTWVCASAKIHFWPNDSQSKADWACTDCAGTPSVPDTD